MIGELATLFEDHIVRTFEQDGEVWFPLIDLASAWGIDRKTPGNLLARNHDLFKGMFLSGGDVTYHDVNERGLYLLMGKISADRLKNPLAKAAIIRFQRWVPELIQRYRKKEIVQVPPAPDIKAELQKAGEYAEICKCDAHTLQAAVFKRHNLPELADALQVPAMQHGESGWYNPTRLIALCNDPDLTPERLNWYLYNKGYQVREGFIWRLTDSGKVHGMEYPYEAPSGHREVRIRWRSSILFASGLIKGEIEKSRLLPGATA